MSDDSELARLKAKRLAEMRRNMSSPAGGGGDPVRESRPGQTAPARDGDAGDRRRILLLRSLGYRGAEVLRNAESQFPAQAGPVIQRLGEMVASGEIREQIDGGRLLALFRSVGIHVRMNTRIHVEKDGKLVSLSDKLGTDRAAAAAAAGGDGDGGEKGDI